MKKRILAGILTAMLLLSGCSAGTETETSSAPASEPVSASTSESEPVSEEESISQEESESSDSAESTPEEEVPADLSSQQSMAETAATTEPPQVYGAEEAEEHSLEGGPQWIYNYAYQTIDGTLIRYIGSERFDDWVKNTDTPHNMQTCIETFDLTPEEIKQALDAGGERVEGMSLTDQEIDILCSGDQTAINRAFASDYAAVSDSGSIYTLFWLASHTAADYEVEGISTEEIQSVLTALEADGYTDEEYLVPLQEQAALMN